MSTLNVNKIVDASGGVFAPVSSVHKNRIINGAMVFDQRNAGASITPTNGQFSIDRWACFLSQASKYTVQQDAGAVTPPVGFTDYLGVTSSSAYTVGAAEWFGIAQRIEGFNIADLGWGTANDKTVTLSFWVRSSLTGTFGGSLNNNGFTYNYPFNYTISAANTWEQKSITIVGATTGAWLTTNGSGVQVHFGLGLGSTFSGTAGAWTATSNILSATGATSVVGTNGATWYITGVQLEVGTQATSFEYRQYQQELALCQRYYQLITTASGGAASGSSFQCAAILSPPMRATPSISGTTARCSDLFAADFSTASPTFGTFETMGVSGGRLEISGFSGMTTGRPTILLSGSTNAAPVRFSAEL